MRLSYETRERYRSNPTISMPSFDEALKQMAYPSIDAVPSNIILRIFEIAESEGISTEEAAERIVQAVTKTTRREVIEKLSMCLEKANQTSH